MDNPACDLKKLHNTYRQFHLVNRFVSGWRRVYRAYLKPAMTSGRRYTLLDIGFGGGDVPVKLAGWAQEDGLKLEITAIDTDERAVAYVQERRRPKGVTFRLDSSGALLRRGERFDFVISNHLLHHLPREGVEAMCHETRRLSWKLVIHNDIERGDLAYLGFAALTGPFFRDSFITADGLASIRRSYTHNELARLAPEGWRVKRMLPYRQLLIYEKG